MSFTYQLADDNVDCTERRYKNAKQQSSVEDGVWYFSPRFYNAQMITFATSFLAS